MNFDWGRQGADLRYLKWKGMACSGNSRLPLEEESCTTRKDSSSSSASTSTNASVVEDGNGDSSRCPIPALHLPPKRDFYEIRKSCLNADVLYEDPEFPATDASLYFSRNPQKPVVWKRPWVMLQNYWMNTRAIWVYREHGWNKGGFLPTSCGRCPLSTPMFLVNANHPLSLYSWIHPSFFILTCIHHFLIPGFVPTQQYSAWAFCWWWKSVPHYTRRARLVNFTFQSSRIALSLHSSSYKWVVINASLPVPDVPLHHLQVIRGLSWQLLVSLHTKIFCSKWFLAIRISTKTVMLASSNSASGVMGNGRRCWSMTGCLLCKAT